MLTDSVLAGSPNIDNHFVTGTQTIVQGSGDVDAGFKSQVTGIEDVSSENLVPTCEVLSARMVFQHIGGVFFHFLTKA